MTWSLVALGLLVASAAAAQPQPPARQRQDRRAALPTTATDPTPEVYVTAGTLTTVAFSGPLDRDSLVVDRTRFRWLDVGIMPSIPWLPASAPLLRESQRH